ncbi:MAG: hypothetical protein A2X59_05245 [Nitrospirae bacterium GWC2_42_7]|nr:MAG: hypothetical protein A2X59_05245 [Nitrospirae bacterium GWC2_42_7]
MLYGKLQKLIEFSPPPPKSIANFPAVAGIITSKVVKSGKSNGWQGSLEELSQIKDILSEFNIYYVDDFVGEWAHRQR